MTATQSGNKTARTDIANQSGNITATTEKIKMYSKSNWNYENNAPKLVRNSNGCMKGTVVVDGM